jgi:serine/threonine-protein kinase
MLEPARWQAASSYLDEALELDEPSREAWLAALGEREPAIAADVRWLLDHNRASEGEGFLEGTAPHPISPQSLAGHSVGAYTVLDAIGQGGMGTVWRAERSDGRFHRIAAIKFLNVGLMGQLGQERFTREGGILARLTHPHIAQLVDAGVSTWGQPYLVLEYVDGAPIDRYCEQARLDLAGRVRLFLDVASAVEQAHAHLIVHRDLKPSNVLVTAAGDVKLLDFGIARLLDDQDPLTPATLTREGGAAMTPAFAAPEQITGAPITTATDVYALGALLYLLLTGTHVTGDTTQSPAELVKAIVESEPRPMSSFPGANIPADLETIVRTALKKTPAERYGSVAAMSADLGRFLRHEPIAARPDTLAYRTGKLVRRHRVPVSLAALALVALSFGFYEINRQRTIAERRFLEVRQLAGRLFEIDVPLRGIAGTSKVRQMIVDTSLEYLQRLGDEVDDDPDLALEIGTAYMRVARVQGIPISINLGQADEAEKNLQIAERIVAGVLDSQPSNHLAFLRMGQIKHDRMILAGNRRPDDAALPLAKGSAMWLGKYLDSGPIDKAEGQQVLLAMNNVSNRFRITRQYDEALRWSYRAIELAPSLDQPFQMGGLLAGTAVIHRDRGDLDAALKDARQATPILESIPGRANDASVRLLVSLALAREGAILGDPDGISLNRPGDAMAPLERSFAIADEIAHKDPDDAFSNGRVQTAGMILASIALDSDPQQSLARYDHLLKHFAQIKNNPQMRRYEVRAEAAAVYPLLRLGRIDAARERLKIAFARLSDLKLYPAADVELGSETDDALRASAEVEARSGNLSRALEIDNALLEQIEASKPEPEEDLSDALDLSRLLSSLADLNTAARLPDRASAQQQRRLALWQHWDRTLPGNAFVRRQLDAAMTACAATTQTK